MPAGPPGFSQQGAPGQAPPFFQNVSSATQPQQGSPDYFQQPQQQHADPTLSRPRNSNNMTAGGHQPAAPSPTDLARSAGPVNNGSFGGGGGQRTPPPTDPLTPNTAKPQRSRPAPPNKRIDTTQIPSPCRDLPADTAGTNRPRYATSRNAPPMCLTNFIGVDDGNANPKFFRPTLFAVPHDEAFARESGVDLGAVISPLFQPIDAEEAVSIVSGRPPIRCKRCRAYVNAHAPFVELGRRWTCNFCDMSNDVAPDYFSNLDGQGKRRDAAEKPELSRGSVEYDVDANEEYALKNDKNIAMPAKMMHHLFAIDISKTSRAHLPDIVKTLRETLTKMSQIYPTCKVSFFTYASALHFYNFQHPQVPQLVVPDVDDPFVPLPFNLICWMSLSSEMEKILTFLGRLEQLSDDAEETECAIGAAVKVASIILSANGGKLILTGHKLPSVGCGALKPRDQQKIYGTDQEKTLLKPIDGFWFNMSIECAKKQITIDLLMFPEDYVELITLGQVCHLTNGAQHLFLNYNGQQDFHRLEAAVEQSLLQEAGYAAILRIRCSNGLRVSKYCGHYLSQDAHDMDLAGITGSSTFYVEFGYEGKLDPKHYAYFQCALLYTTRSGHRRVRVHTLKLPICNTYAALYRNADLETCAISLIHHAIHEAVNKGPKAARESCNERVVKLLTAYRKFCSSGSNTAQLLMPEQLKLLPVYTVCLLKSDALTIGTSTRIDERVQCISDLMTMPLHRVLQFLYPRLYAVHHLLQHQNAGTLNPNTGLCYLPSLQQLTSDVVMSHGIYVLHDQQAKLVYLWIGSQVSPRVSQGLFGVDDAALAGTQVHMEQFHERLRNVLTAVMTRDTGMDRLLVVHERDASEDAFFRNLLEDENIPGSQSYADFLCYLHKMINTKLS